RLRLNFLGYALRRPAIAEEAGFGVAADVDAVRLVAAENPNVGGVLPQEEGHMPLPRRIAALEHDNIAALPPVGPGPPFEVGTGRQRSGPLYPRLAQHRMSEGGAPCGFVVLDPRMAGIGKEGQNLGLVFAADNLFQPDKLESGDQMGGIARLQFLEIGG